MGLVRTNWSPEAMVAKMRQVGERSLRGAAAEMRSEAGVITHLAKSYAPHRDGVLEDSIEAVESRDSKGRVEIAIGLDGTRFSKGGTPVWDYGERMHNSYYRLGPGSRAKDAGRGVVGRLFLTRALRQRLGLLGRRLAARARRAIRGGQ